MRNKKLDNLAIRGEIDDRKSNLGGIEVEINQTGVMNQVGGIQDWIKIPNVHYHVRHIHSLHSQKAELDVKLEDNHIFKCIVPHNVKNSKALQWLLFCIRSINNHILRECRNIFLWNCRNSISVRMRFANLTDLIHVRTILQRWLKSLWNDKMSKCLNSTEENPQNQDRSTM